MSNYERAVFISYAWGEEREDIVNQIDENLQKRGIKITRDKRDLGYRGSIREFMQRIGQGNCVILVISDKYLKSKNCMYELVEIADNKQFSDRIFPIILPDAKIYDASERLDYVAYWEQEIETLNKKMRSMRNLAGLQGANEELNDYDRFRSQFDKLVSVLKDMNALTPDMHRESDFNNLYAAIVERMGGVLPTSEDNTKVEEIAPDDWGKPKVNTSGLTDWLRKFTG